VKLQLDALISNVIKLKVIVKELKDVHLVLNFVKMVLVLLLLLNVEMLLVLLIFLINVLMVSVLKKNNIVMILIMVVLIMLNTNVWMDCVYLMKICVKKMLNAQMEKLYVGMVLVKLMKITVQVIWDVL